MTLARNRAWVSLLALGALTTLSSAGASVTLPLLFDGNQQVPGPGDPDGSGSGEITLDANTGDIAWSIQYRGIDPPISMHIHTGAVGEGGNVFIGLGVQTDVPGELVSSIVASPAQVQSIIENPTGFYVNIHTVPFSAGAIRAQLPARFDLVMTGDQLRNGDPDGSGGGPIFFDTGANVISWDFTYEDIADPTMMHIHFGDFGQTGGIIEDLGVRTLGGPGTLIFSKTAPAGNISGFLNDPTGFYINVHNEEFMPGAIRAQIERVADLNGDNVVGPADLAIILGNWGPCPDPPAPCPADLNGDGVVGPADLAILLGNWG